MSAQCSDKMVLEHTKMLAMHGTDIERLTRDVERNEESIATQVARIDAQISDIQGMLRKIAGNGNRGAIDDLRESIFQLAQSIAKEVTLADSKASSAHQRIDEITDEMRAARMFGRTLAAGVVISILGVVLQFIMKI